MRKKSKKPARGLLFLGKMGKNLTEVFDFVIKKIEI